MCREFLYALVEQIVSEGPYQKRFNVIHHAVCDMISAHVVSQFVKGDLPRMDLAALLVKTLVLGFL